MFQVNNTPEMSIQGAPADSMNKLSKLRIVVLFSSDNAF